MAGASRPPNPEVPARIGTPWIGNYPLIPSLQPSCLKRSLNLCVARHRSPERGVTETHSAIDGSARWARWSLRPEALFPTCVWLTRCLVSSTTLKTTPSWSFTRSPETHTPMVPQVRDTPRVVGGRESSGLDARLIPKNMRSLFPMCWVVAKARLARRASLPTEQSGDLVSPTSPFATRFR